MAVRRLGGDRGGFSCPHEHLQSALWVPYAVVMVVKGAVTSVSWIPSAAVTGVTRAAFDYGPGHYDSPPDDRIGSFEELQARGRNDLYRFANRLSAWAEFDGDSDRIIAADYSHDSSGILGGTRLRIGPLSTRFANVALPVLRKPPAGEAQAAVFEQTYGGRTSAPMPRLVEGTRIVRVAAPMVWTTLRLTLRSDGTASGELVGASSFPRHWLYDSDGVLTNKSALADFGAWMRQSGPQRTPWGLSDSPALVTEVESALERELSTAIMREGSKPRLLRLGVGEALTREGEDSTGIFLVLDGLLEVAVGGRILGEIGPGAVVGERSLLEGGLRTATLTATTPIRVAVAAQSSLDPDKLRSLASAHQREDDQQAPEGQ